MIRSCAPCCNCVIPRILTATYPQLKLSLAILCETHSRRLIGLPFFLIALFVVHDAKHGELKRMLFEFEPNRPMPHCANVRVRCVRCDDRLFIQNQGGRHPSKWDKVGTVVEALDFDQYNVKVGRSGRITRRNRLFLRLMPDVAEILQTSLPSTVPPLHKIQFQQSPLASTHVVDETFSEAIDHGQPQNVHDDAPTATPHL